MGRLNLFVLLILMSLSFSLGQNNDPCPCCSENHRAFDFWVGDWTVYNPKGEVVGTNKVVKLQNGCVLQENWKSLKSSNTGTSYNYFDLSDSTWNQVWISNTGNVLNLKGNINKEGEMVLRSKLVNGSKGEYYNQITWVKNDDASVTQQWDILNENGETISLAFMGIYRKVEK